MNITGRCNRDKTACECSAGYTGPLCEEVCPEGTWGNGCNQICACDGQTCHHVTGACSCPAGANCDDDCPAGNSVYALALPIALLYGVRRLRSVSERSGKKECRSQMAVPVYRCDYRVRKYEHTLESNIQKWIMSNSCFAFTAFGSRFANFSWKIVNFSFPSFMNFVQLS